MRTNTINIADILAKQPIGTKLYSPLCGDLFLEKLDNGNGIIYCRTRNYADVGCIKFTEYGRFYFENGCSSDAGECILFPSEALRQWNVAQFENGDIAVVEAHDIRYDDPQIHIMIFKKHDWSDGVIHFHVMMTNSDDLCDHESTLSVTTTPYVRSISCRWPYSDEFSKLKKALSEHHLRWNAEKKCVEPLPNEERQTAPRFKFEPYDKVLVRDGDNDRWQPAFFSVLKEDSAEKFGVIDGYIPTFYSQCIPYNDGTKHLLGTYDPYKPKA